jgi:hypothetical protein
MATRPLTLADFDKERGNRFPFQTAAGVVPLQLAKVQELPGSTREGGAFRLEFHGPPQAPLGQGTFRVVVGGEPRDMFIVPIGSNAQHLRYEAIFF